MTLLTKPAAVVALGLIGFTLINTPSIESFALASETALDARFSDGEGTEASPYLISSVEDLVALGTAVNGGNKMANTYFKLTQNLDLSTIENWTSIGTSPSPFSGIFDGSGYTLSNLTINRPTTQYVGLFGYVGDGGTRTTRISNLALSNVNIAGGNYTGAIAAYAHKYVSLNEISVSGSISGAQYTGGVLGYGYGSSLGVVLQQVSVKGTVTGTIYVGGVAGAVASTSVQKASVNATVTGSRYMVGGLIGRISDGSMLEQLESSGSVSTSTYAGGLVGNLDGGKISTSSSHMTVTGAEFVGGLVGYSSNGLISNSYSLGEAKGTASVGGLAGQLYSNGGRIQQSYSLATVSGTKDVGALVGKSSNGEVQTSYWSAASGVQVAVGTNSGKLQVTKLSSAEFNFSEASTAMSAFDFNGVWKLRNGYPVLAWQQGPGDTLVNGSIQPTLVSFTVPTALSFEINPNLEAGEQFIAPSFTLSNDSSSPLTISVSTFEETSAYDFIDVLGSKYSDAEWAKLGVNESNQLALGVSLDTPDEWLEQAQAETLHAVTVQTADASVKLGTTKPHSSVGLTFVGKHGAAFKEAMTPTYQMTFIFNLLG